MKGLSDSKADEINLSENNYKLQKAKAPAF